MPLFEVAIIQNPTKKEKSEGQEEVLIYGPSPMIAKDYKAANLKALQAVTDFSKLNSSLIEVKIRPFVTG